MERSVAEFETSAFSAAAARPMLTSLALASTCVSIGAILALGRFQSHHNADSLIPILVSLYRWTPYYWEQDRFGMLVPLLCSVVRSPVDNLVVQTFVTITGGIAAMWAIGWYFRASPLAIAATIAVFTITAPIEFQVFYLGTAQPYNLSLLLGFAGLSVCRNDRHGVPAARRLAGVALLTTATWVNAGILILMGPIVFLVEAARGMKAGSIRERLVNGVRAAALNGTSITLMMLFVLSMIAQRFAPFRTTWIVVPALARWPPLIAHFAAEAAGWVGGGMLLWLDLAAILAFAISWMRQTEHPRTADVLSVACGLAIYGCVLAVLFSGRGRYFIPGLLVLHTMIWIAALDYLRPRIASSSAVFLVVCLAAAAGASVRYGWPSRASARANLELGLGTFGTEALDAGATHIIGDYWTVWPAMFEANVLLHERGVTDRVMWGVTFRSRPTEAQWRNPGRSMLLAAREGDAEVPRFFSEFGLQASRQRKTGSVVLFEGR